MYRSGSSTRVSDEFFSPKTTAVPGADVLLQNQLPTYNPESVLGKKEKNRLRSSESAVHLIPLLLVLCAVILWIFSTPVVLSNKGGHVGFTERI